MQNVVTNSGQSRGEAIYPPAPGWVGAAGWVGFMGPQRMQRETRQVLPIWKVPVGHMPIAHLVDHFIQQCGSLTVALEAFP